MAADVQAVKKAQSGWVEVQGVAVFEILIVRGGSFLHEHCMKIA